MSSWHNGAGATDTQQYVRADVRAFNDCTQRAYEAMRRAQRCVRVVLPSTFFGDIIEPAHQVWCCKCPDSAPPRLGCADRTLELRLAVGLCKNHEAARAYITKTRRPWIFGVDPKKHGAPWFSQELIYSFLVGLDDEPIADSAFVCKAALGLRCAGQNAADFRKPPRKQRPLHERRTYNEYAQEDSHNE